MYPYIHVFGRTIGSYGLMMAIGFLLVGTLALCKARRKKVAYEDILIVSAAAIAMALIGGKLLYIFVTYPVSEIWKQILKGDLSALGGGGIVFYGGLIGGVLGAMLGIRIARCRFADVEQVIVPYIPLGHAVGRIGCFLAGCCYGRAYDGMFAVYYPNSVAGVPSDQGYFPIQLAEAAWNIVVMALLLRIERKAKKSMDILSVYISVYAVGRLVLEQFRGDMERGIYWGFSLSQWISIGLIGLCVLRLLHQRWKTLKQN